MVNVFTDWPVLGVAAWLGLGVTALVEVDSLRLVLVPQLVWNVEHVGFVQGVEVNV